MSPANGVVEWGPQQQEALARIRIWLGARYGGQQTFYLAGWAGTGKTTLAQEIASEVRNTKFAAFTGKAASVMAQKGCDGAQTVHRLIYKIDEGATDRSPSGDPVFRLSTSSELVSAGLLILDESSMIGKTLAQDLLSFGVKILVLGDPAQLPPVGEDTGFFTGREPDFQLTEIHRQAEGNPIIQMSQTVRKGNRLNWGQYGDSLVLPAKQVTAAMARQADQILCGRNATRRAKNERMRGLLGRKGLFAPQDRIVCTKNDYGAGLLNGTIWQVQAIEYQDDAETLMSIRGIDPGSEGVTMSVRATNVVVLGTEKDTPKEDLRGFQFFDFAYCLTVHKAQGSQWDTVLVYDESSVFREERHRWAYTAVTRAAKRVIWAV